MTSHAINPETFAFDDEVIVASDELKLSFRIDRDYAEQPAIGSATGYLTAYVAARFSDGAELANYTPIYEHSAARLLPAEIHIDEAGLLSVLSRQQSSKAVDIRHGFTVQLPDTFVEPMREALRTITQQLTDELTVLDSVRKISELFSDDSGQETSACTSKD